MFLAKQLTPVLLAVLLAVTSRPAMAALELTVTDGTTTKSFEDGGAGDQASQPGILSVAYSLGVWFFSASMVASKPAIGDESTALLDLSSLNLSSWGGGTIRISVTDTDYTLPQGGFVGLGAGIGGVTMGLVTYSSYIDTTNTAFGKKDLIGSSGPMTGVFAGTVSNEIEYVPPSPFSLTTEVTVSHAGGGGGQVTSFNSVGTAVVPEPGVVGLLGVGLGIVGLTARRQRRKLELRS